MTPEEVYALDIARGLTRLGIPVFVAPPSANRVGFDLPPAWNRLAADPVAVDAWRPGWALGAVMGHGLDLVDLDLHKRDLAGLMPELERWLPHRWGVATTPSGGRHMFIRSVGVRSRDAVVPGVDVKAGAAGEGHGFAFLAPTVKPSKGTGEPVAYRWVQPPDLTLLAAELRQPADLSGRALVELINAVRATPSSDAPSADTNPEAYAELTAEQRERLASWVTSTIDGILADLKAAADWPEGHLDDRGRGWEKLTADAANRLGRLARAPWSGLGLDQGRELLLEAAPTDASWRLDDVEEKWRTQSGRGEPMTLPDLRTPGERDAEAWAQMGITAPAGASAVWTASAQAGEFRAPFDLAENAVARTIAERELVGRYCWSAGLHWMRYEDGRWAAVDDEVVFGVVREAVEAMWFAEARAETDAKRMGKLLSLRTRSKTVSLTSTSRNIAGVHHDATDFDAHPDLLCVGNGVVELATGQLLPHDPGLLLTKRTPVDYVPGATSKDWDAALSALPLEAAGWLQVRLGQAATGHPTSDDVLPVLQGSGSNGKTTLVGAVLHALGDHAVAVPERVLMANPSDHPTELMTLRGARLALIEETPEGRRLGVKRLKDLLGTSTITARAIRRDNVTWKATHSLVLTTNYTPAVAETDHGTWRRLALIRFPFTFVPLGRPLDGPLKRESVVGIRERLAAGANGAHEAVLAWLVAGAQNWYASGKLLPAPPPSVRRDTDSWRAEADLVIAYANERLVLGEGAAGRHVMSADLFDDFRNFVAGRGQQPWSETLFLTRFGEHDAAVTAGIRKSRMRPGDGLSRPPAQNGMQLPARLLPKQYTGWLGVMFSDPDVAPATEDSEASR